MSKGPRYPKWGTYEGNRNPKSGRTCRSCGAVRAGRAHIQVSIFRGDDEVVPCCKRCYETKTPQELLVAGRVPQPAETP